MAVGPCRTGPPAAGPLHGVQAWRHSVTDWRSPKGGMPDGDKRESVGGAGRRPVRIPAPAGQFRACHAAPGRGAGGPGTRRRRRSPTAVDLDRWTRPRGRRPGRGPAAHPWDGPVRTARPAADRQPQKDHRPAADTGDVGDVGDVGRTPVGPGHDRGRWDPHRDRAPDRLAYGP